jgi:branched-subunit amino acid aminotransferase/4-amino-4-deoxychorismate lyase
VEDHGGRREEIRFADHDRRPAKGAADGLSLAVSPYRVNTFSPLTGIKSLNYLDHVLSREEAKSRDFDEAVVLNERGEIVSATMANLFWVRNGTLHTPALSTGALAGITRECVIEIANKHFIPLLEGIYEMPDLTDADEIFLTSSGVGSRRDDVRLSTLCGEGGPLTTTIAHAFDSCRRYRFQMNR